MKKLFLTFFLLPLFSMTFAPTNVFAEARPWFAPAKQVARQSAKQTCVAILAATTGFAVYTTNLVHKDNSMPILSIKNGLYRNRKAMHVFLAKGFGRRVMEFFNIKLDLRAVPEETHVTQEWKNESLETVFTRWDEETFRRSLLFDSTSTPERATGFLLLPGLLCRFDFTQIADGVYEYKLYDLFKGGVVQSGQLAAVNVLVP